LTNTPGIEKHEDRINGDTSSFESTLHILI
jgi:hypothetical protein